MTLTTDPTDPRLGHGPDDKPGPQNEVYLVLSEEERAKGFVRPLRRSYIHVGPPGPRYPLRDLTDDEQERWGEFYDKFEEYPPEIQEQVTGTYSRGKFWTNEQLERVGRGCRTETRMGLALCETYAREPRFYGSTYCVGCQMHLPVSEFVWAEDNERLGS